MIENIVLDTNILIYNLDEESKYFQITKDILNNTDYNVFVTSKTISEFPAVLSKYDFDIKIISKELKNITENFNILFPNNISMKIFIEMIKKYNPRGNRFFDIEIVSIMIANDIKKIATINYKDFKNIEEIEIINK